MAALITTDYFLIFLLFATYGLLAGAIGVLNIELLKLKFAKTDILPYRTTMSHQSIFLTMFCDLKFLLNRRHSTQSVNIISLKGEGWWQDSGRAKLMGGCHHLAPCLL